MVRRIAVLLALLCGCAVQPQTSTGALEGRIWDVRAEKFIPQDELLLRLRAVRYRLLGEVHDHPEHHRLRASLIGRLATPGAPAEIYFEQFDRENDHALREAQRAGGDAEALAGAGRLEGSWKWPLHRPLLQAALAAGYPVRGANLSRADARRIASAGALAPDDTELAGMLARADWSAQREQALRDEIYESHCRELPDKLAPAMALAQRARDAALALALAAASGSAVLIAGNGHVRKDYGVPRYLPRGSTVMSVGFLETRADDTDPRAYARGTGGEAAYDYVWFTAPQPRPDPCEALRKR